VQMQLRLRGGRDILLGTQRLTIKGWTN
jgi:hypothetical protein